MADTIRENAGGARLRPLEPELPEGLGFGSDQVFAIAESVASQLGFVPGGDLREIVGKLGGSISYSSLDDGLSDSGSIEIRDGSFEISLSLDTSPLRDRFTIAHELGHWALHYLYPNQKLGKNITWLRAERYGAGQAEREANWFAAAFLMPATQFREEFEKCDGDMLQLSRIFKVSTHAASIRARVLKLEAQVDA